jgi:acetyl esterase/lipase
MNTCPPPDVADCPYGPHERQRLDLWFGLRKPAPLVVWIHGGGWYQGHKGGEATAQIVNDCRAAGCAVAAIGYRLSQDAIAPAPMLDCASAVEFLRSRATEWGLNPRRFGATGVSAGGWNSLWLGFRGQVSAVFTVNTPTFLDVTSPHAGEVPAPAFQHIALPRLVGGPPESAQPLLREIAPLYLAHAGAPPVFLLYGQRRALPGPDCTPGKAIHHSSFGAVLKRRLDELGVECTFRCRDDYPTTNEDEFNRQWKAERVEFFTRHLCSPTAS